MHSRDDNLKSFDRRNGTYRQTKTQRTQTKIKVSNVRRSS